MVTRRVTIKGGALACKGVPLDGFPLGNNKAVKIFDFNSLHAFKIEDFNSKKDNILIVSLLFPMRVSLERVNQIEDLIELALLNQIFDLIQLLALFLYALVLFCYPFKGHPHSCPLYALVLACFLCGCPLKG